MLLHKGKALQDGTLIQEYNLREADKLHFDVQHSRNKGHQETYFRLHRNPDLASEEESVGGGDACVVLVYRISLFSAKIKQ